MPAISIILPTDTFDSIKGVLEKLRQQTIAESLEVILLSETPDDLAPSEEYAGCFAALRRLKTPSLIPLATARAMGIRAARADWVFIGEIHSYLRFDALEKLAAAAASGRWTIVVPGFENANPRGVMSWSAFLGNYGRWSSALPAGEIHEAPVYDCLQRRAALMGFGDHLESLIASGEALRQALRAAGHRVYFEPTAILGHVNIEHAGAWFNEHLLMGSSIGQQRAKRWPVWRRLLYMAGTALVPLVLMSRSWTVLAFVRREVKVPLGTTLVVFVLYATKALGELRGLAGYGWGHSQQEAMERYEIRRADYVT